MFKKKIIYISKLSKHCFIQHQTYSSQKNIVSKMFIQIFVFQNVRNYLLFKKKTFYITNFKTYVCLFLFKTSKTFFSTSFQSVFF